VQKHLFPIHHLEAQVQDICRKIYATRSEWEDLRGELQKHLDIIDNMFIVGVPKGLKRAF
jgi:hypothetical protein